MTESLTEMSSGQWEGLPRFEIYTSEINQLIERTNPDFAPPSGESLRQVSFRVVEFLNRLVLRLPEKLSLEQPDHKVLPFSRQNSMNLAYQEQKEMSIPGLHWLNRPNLQRKKSGKSRLQFVGDINDFEDDLSPREARAESSVVNFSGSIGIFTHSALIKCLITALLDCSPAASQRICIDDSSVTVLEHSLKTGWQIKRMNDTSHLRLL
jgi:broad specificity phosphatase PhoE